MCQWEQRGLVVVAVVDIKLHACLTLTVDRELHIALVLSAVCIEKEAGWAPQTI